MLNLKELIAWLDILIITAIIHCLIMGTILFFQEEKKLSNRLLGTMILIFAFYQVRLILYDLDLNQSLALFFQLPIIFLWGIGPLLYFYTKSLINEGYKLSGKELLHLTPVIPEFLLNLYFNNVVVSDQESYQQSAFQIFSTLELAIAITSIAFYVGKSLRAIKQHTNWVLTYYSYTKNVILNWLGRLLKYYRVWWLLMVIYITFWFMAFNEVPLFTNDEWYFMLFHLLIIGLNYFTYFIGLAHYRRLDTLRVIPYPVEESLQNTKSAEKKQGAPEPKLVHIATLILTAMEDDKLYLKESLTLYDLSKHLNVSTNLLSQTLNQELGKRFHEFVNTYRLEEFKRRAQDPDYKHYTILGIALESGFNSKATFNRIFKSYTAQSPSQYMKSIRN